MTEPEHDYQEQLAAEYVLGTLDAEERTRARALAEMDSAFAALVRAWERWLGELNVLVAEVEPPPEIWERIRATLPETAMPAVASPPSSPVESPPIAIPPEPTALEDMRPVAVEPAFQAQPAIADQGPIPDQAPEVARLRRRAGRWRSLALLFFLVIAAGVAFGAVRETRPEYLPVQLRPKVNTIQVTKNVEVPSPKPAQFVAVLDKDGVQPAFLLTFDLDRRTLMVRNVSAPLQPGKSYQLWLKSDKFDAPQSLGVIGTEEYTRPQLANYDSVLLNSATYLVSLEPEGGSPTGAPSGPIVYSGRLIQATPIGFRDQTP